MIGEALSSRDQVAILRPDRDCGRKATKTVNGAQTIHDFAWLFINFFILYCFGDRGGGRSWAIARILGGGRGFHGRRGRGREGLVRR